MESSIKKLGKHEELLIELIHFLAYGTKTETGLTLKDTKNFLTKPIASKGDRNCLQCLREERREFLNELITFINEVDGKV